MLSQRAISIAWIWLQLGFALLLNHHIGHIYGRNSLCINKYKLLVLDRVISVKASSASRGSNHGSCVDVLSPSLADLGIAHCPAMWSMLCRAHNTLSSALPSVLSSSRTGRSVGANFVVREVKGVVDVRNGYHNKGRFKGA